MPKFKVTIVQDAWIYHQAEIEANDKADAAQQAWDGWKRGGVEFTEIGSNGFDHIEDPREDLDDSVEEIEDEDKEEVEGADSQPRAVD